MFWHVYNSLSGEQRVVEATSLSGFLTSLNEDQLPYTFVWKEEWAEWRAFLEVPELHNLRKKIPTPPARGLRATSNFTEPTPVPPKDFPLEVIETSFVRQQKKKEVRLELEDRRLPEPTSEEAQVFAVPVVMPPEISFEAAKKPAKPPPGAKPKERRKHERVDASLNVIITIDNAVFRARSVDLNAAGIRVEETVPESMLKKPVTIVVSSPDFKTKLRLIAELVGDPKDAKRFKFHEPSQAQTEQIEAWIVEMNEIKKHSA